METPQTKTAHPYILNYAETKSDPVLAIQLFLNSYDEGKGPAPAFVDWLADCLNEWWKSEGEKELDSIMGLESKGKGEDRPFVAARIKRRNELIFKDVAFLMKSYGLKKKEAVHAVWKKLVASKIEDPVWNVKGILSEKSIAQEYKEWPYRKKWEDIFANCKRNPKYIETFPPKAFGDTTIRKLK